MCASTSLPQFRFGGDRLRALRPLVFLIFRCYDPLLPGMGVFYIAFSPDVPRHGNFMST